jgi:tetratricopeptide (TPR) repeat protein
MPTPNRAAPRFLASETVVGLLLVFFTVAVFAVACGNGFAYDDRIYVTENPAVQSGLTATSIHWAWTTFHGSNWHPLTWMSLELDAALGGVTHPWIFHLTNVVLHAAGTLLLFHVLYRMTAALWRSAVVAALFAVHPAHVESVAWVAERKDVLSTVFWMLTLLAYLRYVERPGWARYLIMMAAFALGLMAKPMLVTLPFVLLLLDYWPLERFSLRALSSAAKDKTGSRSSDRSAKPPAREAGLTALPRSLPWLFWEKVPLFGLTTAACIVAWWSQRVGGSVASLDRFPLGARVGNALVAYCSYIGKMLWPTSLVAFYPHPRTSLPVWQVLAALALLALLSALFLIKLRHLRYLAVGWLWYLGTLVPVIGLVQVGGQSMADRYTYVPFIGLFILGTWGAADLLHRWQWQKAAVPAAAALLAVSSALTIMQERCWFDDLTLWAHALQVDEKNPVAHNNYGNQIIKKRPTDEEKERYRRLVQIAPEYWTTARGEERAADGLRHYRRAFELDPNHWGAAHNIGMELAYQQRFAEALQYLQTAVRGDPGKPIWQFNLGVTLVRVGQFQAAREHLEKALQLDPDYAPAHNALGKALEGLGNRDEAVREYAAAVRQYAATTPPDPASAIAQSNLGNLLFIKGDLDGAVEHLRAVLKINPENSGVCYTLARVYGQKGKWDEAVNCAQAAVRLQPRTELYHCRLAYTLMKYGRAEAAQAEYQEASRLNPKWPERADQEARKVLSNPNLDGSDPLLPLELAEQTCQATGNREPKYLHTLAIAYGAIGKYGEAAKIAGTALQRAGSQPELAKEIEKNLKRFESGQPGELSSR